MFKNHLKIVLRKLKKEKLYTVVNIFGLTIGLTTFLLISLYVRDELSFDKFHDNEQNIYRLIRTNERLGVSGKTASDLVDYFSYDMPEIEDFNRLIDLGNQTLVSLEDQQFNTSQVFYAQDNFFEFFSFDLLTGSSGSVFTGGNKAVLTESFSKKLFGDEDPIGKLIRVEKREQYLITGIAKDNPANSTIQFQVLLNKPGVFTNDFENTGGVKTAITFLKVSPNLDLDKLVNHINAARERPSYNIFTQDTEYSLLPLTRQRLYASYESDIFDKNDIRYVKLFSGIGVLVLLLAVINYINLVTAQSIERMKEVGLRKVIGASRRDLIGYQLVESIVITMFSFLLAFAITERLVPFYNEILDKDIQIAYFGLEFFLWVVLAGLGLGLLSGIYPALYTSRGRPLALLQKQASRFIGANWLKKGLAFAQFTATALLITILALMNKQMTFLKEKDLGFETDFTVEINLDRDSTHLYQSLKNQIMTISGVENVSLNGFDIGGGWISTIYAEPKVEGKSRGNSVAEKIIRADGNMINTLDMGFYWQAEKYDSSGFDDNQIIINYSLADKLGWLTDPMGRKLYEYNDRTGQELVAIVNDFHINSLKEEVEPMFILPLSDWGANRLIVKLNGSEGFKKISEIEALYQSLFDRPFEYAFLEDKLESFYKKEVGQFKMFQVFSLLAVIISLLGLIALTTYMVAQRRKEVSIRKVLGASVKELLLLLNKEYSVLVLIAFIAASPVAYFFMEDWLSHFVYRITVGPMPFIIGLIGFLGLSYLVTAYQSVRASAENPAKVLREE